MCKIKTKKSKSDVQIKESIWNFQKIFRCLSYTWRFREGKGALIYRHFDPEFLFPLVLNASKNSYISCDT